MNPRERLNKIYQDVQNLELQPTEHNVMLLADIMIGLKEVWAAIPETNPESETETEEVEADG